MIKIEVESSTVDERSGVKNGKPWTIREQGAYAHILDEFGKPGKYPVRCRLGLEDKAPAYQPGMYTFDARAIIVGDFDRLGLGRVKLVPYVAAKQA